MQLRRAVPILTVADVSGAVRQYGERLGLTVVMNHGWIATLGDSAGPQFSVMHEDATAPVNPNASLQVDDLDRALDEVRAAGLRIVHGPADEAWGVRRFLFEDPDGNVVNVLAHLPVGDEPLAGGNR